MRTNIHSPVEWRKGRIAQEDIVRGRGVLHKRQFDCLHGASWSCKMEGWTSGNLQMQLLASWHLPARPFCRVINPRIMSIALILKISVYSVNVPGLYPATGKNVPLHLALQPQNIILQNCPHTNSYSSNSNIFKYCNYKISGLHWRANWRWSPLILNTFYKFPFPAFFIACWCKNSTVWLSFIWPDGKCEQCRKRK